MNSIIPQPISLSLDELRLYEPLPETKDPALVYLTSNMKSDKGRYTQGRVILTIASWLGMDPRLVNWAAFRNEHVAALCTYAGRLYKPATARKYRSALMGIATQAFALGYMEADQYQRIKLVPPIPGKSARKERYMSQGEINAIFDACAADPSKAGVRDAAILSLLYVDAIRREGIVNIDMEHFQEVEIDGRKVIKLIVLGKGNEEYSAYVTNDAKTILDEWLSLRGTAPGPLFLEIKQTGRIIYTGKREIVDGKEDWVDRLSDQAIYKIVKKRCAQAGVENVSPHDFRHTSASRMWKEHVDGSTIQRILNHKSMDTTAGYDSRPDEEKITGVDVLYVKWKKHTQKSPS